jgi:TolA-binding protein
MFWAPCATHGLAATQSEDTKPETSNSQRQKVQKQIEQKLRELDREINELKTEAPNNGDQLHEQFQREMADLQQKREMARKKFEKLKASAEGA